LVVELVQQAGIFLEEYYGVSISDIFEVELVQQAGIFLEAL
jgi:hypothetical protein